MSSVRSPAENLHLAGDTLGYEQVIKLLQMQQKQQPDIRSADLINYLMYTPTTQLRDVSASIGRPEEFGSVKEDYEYRHTSSGTGLNRIRTMGAALQLPRIYDGTGTLQTNPLPAAPTYVRGAGSTGFAHNTGPALTGNATEAYTTKQTLAAWVYIPDGWGSGANHNIVDSKLLRIRIETQGRLRAMVRNWSNNTLYDGVNSPPIRTGWHHAAVTWNNNGTCRSYIDGAQVGVYANPSLVEEPQTNQPLWTTTRRGNGKDTGLAWVMWFDTDLSADEIMGIKDGVISDNAANHEIAVIPMYPGVPLKIEPYGIVGRCAI